MNAHVNPFQEYLVGVRYLMTDKDKLPEGYAPLLTKGTAVLAQNKNVLPSAYGSTALFSEKEFDALNYPQTLQHLPTGPSSRKYLLDKPPLTARL